MSSAGVFALVLLAAFFHATWNAGVKGASDKGLVLGLVSLSHVILGGVMALFLPFPPLHVWPFIAASTVIHFLYYILLFHSYRLGDLSQVYPIARGLAPILVTVGAQVFIGEVLPGIAWAGILVVSFGILALALQARKAQGLAILLAIATGFVIAAYSIVDGIGVRSTPVAMSYVAWLFISEIFVTLYVGIGRGRALLTVDRRIWAIGLGGGVVSTLAYAIVLYAKTLAPLGLVSTLRETSVIFAALIGIVLFKERPWILRAFASIIVALGIVGLSLVT